MRWVTPATVALAVLAITGPGPAEARGPWLWLEKNLMGTRHLTADQGYVYAVRADGTIHRMARRSGRDRRWELVDPSRDNLDAEASLGSLYVVKRSRELWKLDVGVYLTSGLPERPSWLPRIDRWELVPDAIDVRQVAVTGDVVFTLRSSGEVWKHVHGSSWKVSGDLQVAYLDAHEESLWMLTEGGEVWRSITRHPLRMEPYYRGGDAVDVQGGGGVAFVLTGNGEIRHGSRVIATGARGARLEGLGNHNLYVQLPWDQVWRYENEGWYLEDDLGGVRSLAVADSILYAVVSGGRVAFRRPRAWPEKPHAFGVMDFAEQRVLGSQTSE